MPKKYKVFHLIKGLGRGGAERLLSEGLQYADLSTFKYGFGYFLPWKDALVSTLRDAGSEVTCFQSTNAFLLLSSVPRVSKFLKQWRPDIIHCHLPLSGIVGRLAGKWCRIPVVYTEHNVQERYHPWTRRLNLLTWKLQNRVVAVSHEVARSIQVYAKSDVPVQVVQNGVSTDLFRRDPAAGIRVRQELGIAPETAVIGTVAALRQPKNLSGWLKAANLILQNYPDVHFLIVGDGPLRIDLQKTASQLGLERKVHFVGLKEDVIPYLSAMDIYMISSLFEGLPIALLEAMSAKLPVVSTAVGGIVEVIDDTKNGLLVNTNAPEALCEQACILLGNSSLRHQFGEAGRSVVEQRFSIQRMVGELEQIYLEILQSAHKTTEQIVISPPL